MEDPVAINTQVDPSISHEVIPCVHFGMANFTSRCDRADCGKLEEERSAEKAVCASLSEEYSKAVAKTGMVIFYPFANALKPIRHSQKTRRLRRSLNFMIECLGGMMTLLGKGMS